MLQSFTDQLNRTIEINFPPERIISLVPSQTELLFSLGLDNEVVGLTKFCIHPIEKYKATPRIGGTKKINFDKIAELQPDLIIANKEENQKDQIEQLMQQFPVWISDIHNLNDALDMIKKIGALTNKAEKAEEIVQAIQIGFRQLQPLRQPKATAYFIWRNPYMTVGGDTFINHILARCGFKNVFENKGRYPQVTSAEIKAAHPEIVFLSSEPYPFKQRHIEELKKIAPQAEILLVDGEMFSWYGSRLLQAPEYLQEIIKAVE